MPTVCPLCGKDVTPTPVGWQCVPCGLTQQRRIVAMQIQVKTITCRLCAERERDSQFLAAGLGSDGSLILQCHVCKGLVLKMNLPHAAFSELWKQLSDSKPEQEDPG